MSKLQESSLLASNRRNMAGNCLALAALAALGLWLSLGEAQAFLAAAGKVDITPDLSRETIWLAGYGARGRRAQGIRDPLYARALVVSDGDKVVALAAVDSIGIFREDVEDMRRELGWQGDKRYLFLAATHDHSAPDTLGLWGRFPGISGVDPHYRRRLKASVLQLVRELASALEPAELLAEKSELNPRGLCHDSRDPVVLDPELNVFQLRTLQGKALGTVLRWSCHPEVLGPQNMHITADFPGRLCSRIEQSSGGTCVYFSGLIGGLLSPDVDRSLGLEQQFSQAERLGEKLAQEALSAIRRAKRPIRKGSVSFDFQIVRVPVENSRYLLFLPNLTFGHKLFDAGGNILGRWQAYALSLRHLIFFPLPEKLRPWVETEVSRIRLGPVELVGIPGELFPELAIGGYDGSHSYGYPLVRPNNPNPPDLSRAPPGPYLRQRLKEHGMIVSLANDEIGYIIPEYDFQVTPNRSMAPRPSGTHYEETNSIGPSATAILFKALDQILK